MIRFQLDSAKKVPVYQQIVDQVHFAVNAGELVPGSPLPSLRTLAQECGVALNTMAKAFRILELRGVLVAIDRVGYQIAEHPLQSRVEKYAARGVSSQKSEVHSAIQSIDPGIFPGAFCKVTEDYLTGDPDLCNVIHSDGSGTKSLLAYLTYRETGRTDVYRGIAQDSIVMNVDDLLCIGATGRMMISSTINRNSVHCPGEVIAELIRGNEEFLKKMREFGVPIYSGGGETADVGDLTGTALVDTCIVSVMNKKSVITGEEIRPGLSIVGLSSTGQATYEDSENSGIGSNGLTSARHDLLCSYYKENYPETFDSNTPDELVYCGPYRLEDDLPHSSLTIGQALLSPTRTYAPVILDLLRTLPEEIKGVIHCSGGGQTKCRRFGKGVRYVKDRLFEIPPLFRLIQSVSKTEAREMVQVYNMGHRMEVYCPPEKVAQVIKISEKYGIEAREIGRIEAATASENEVVIHHPDEGILEFSCHSGKSNT